MLAELVRESGQNQARGECAALAEEKRAFGQTIGALFVSFRTVVRLTQHFTVNFGCFSAFTPRFDMVSVHLVELPYLGLRSSRPNRAIGAIRFPRLLCFFGLPRIDHLLDSVIKESNVEKVQILFLGPAEQVLPDPRPFMNS